MSTRFRTPRLGALLALSTLLTACGGGERSAAGDSATGTAPATQGGTPSAAPAGSASGDAQLADLAQYRLTMDKVDQYMAAQRNIATKAAALSPAERAAIAARGEQQSNGNASLDDMVRTIESEPLMVGAIREAGLSAREFTMITMSMMQSGMAAAVVKMRPNDNRDSLVRAMSASPENVKFMIDNEAELNRRQREIEAVMQRLQPADSAGG